MLHHPFRFAQFSTARILAVDCGAAHVACAGFVGGTGGRLRLLRFEHEPHNPDPAAGARWLEFVGGALAGIAGRKKMRGTCRLMLPGHHTLTKFVRTPAVEPARRARIVEFEAQQSMPCPLAELVWDHLCLADDGTELELMLAAAKREVVEPVCLTAAVARFSIAQILPAPLVLLRAFRYNYPEVREAALVVSIGARSTQIVFVEGERFFGRTAALGGNAVTQAVADELRIDFLAAEALKLQVLGGNAEAGKNFAAADTVRLAAARFAGRLHLELVRTMARTGPDETPARPAVVYLSGGGALLPDLTVQLADKLKVRMERYDPLRHVEVAVGMRLAGPTDRLAPELIGLAAGPGPDEPGAFNLLPPREAQARKFRQRLPFLVVSALLAIAALAPVVWHYQRLVGVTDESVAMIERQLVPLRELVARNAGNLARLETAKARIAALQGAWEMKSSWIDFLGDLQERLEEVEDVWLEKLQVVPGPSLRLALSGRLLDWNNPVSKVSPDSFQRVRRLFQLFGQSDYVAAVEGERFDNLQPGILRFDCTLVMDPRKPL